jgi:hypothetical protein
MLMQAIRVLFQSGAGSWEKRMLLALLLTCFLPGCARQAIYYRQTRQG